MNKIRFNIVKIFQTVGFNMDIQTVDNLSSLKYHEIQKVAKSYGIKANQKIRPA